VDEHRVEGPTEPDRPHVALDVLALRVQAPADLEHAGRAVDEREVEPCLQVRGVVPAAGAELEHLLDRDLRAVLDEGTVLRGLVRVLLWSRQERPPLGEVAVQAWQFHAAHHTWL
jgi:hypothetical protein